MFDPEKGDVLRNTLKTLKAHGVKIKDITIDDPEGR